MHGHPWHYAYGWWPDTLLWALSTLLWLGVFVGLVWLLLRWIMPYIRPMISDIFGIAPPDASPLEILRQRFAAGEIDAITFEQMRERLEASYSHPLYDCPANQG
ncbi:MAG: SHOCT domain-containing protein, partial [Chloroflexi bacterium]